MDDSHEDKYLKAFEKLSDKLDEFRTESSAENAETSQCVTKLDKTLALHIQNTNHGFEKISELDMQQNILLKEHAKRSDQLEIDNELRDKAIREQLWNPKKGDLPLVKARVTVLEEPRKIAKTLFTGLKWLGTGAMGFIALLKILEWLKNLL